jgi:hypothetical protein
MLDFTVLKVEGSEFKLEDGTIIRVTPVLNDVNVTLDDNGNISLQENGLPAYNFNMGFNLKVLPRNREMFIPKPPQQKKPPEGLTS